MTISYEQVSGVGALRTEGWIRDTFLHQRTRYLLGEIRLIPFGLFYIIEINMKLICMVDMWIKYGACLEEKVVVCLGGGVQGVDRTMYNAHWVAPGRMIWSYLGFTYLGLEK